MERRNSASARGGSERLLSFDTGEKADITAMRNHEVAGFIELLSVANADRSYPSICHGGSVTAAGNATVTATHTPVEPAVRRCRVTIELKITYLRPARPGLLVADAHVIKRDRTITIVETEI